MVDESRTARDTILAAAVRVLQEEGPAKLTQTRVAKVAGVRQGHLTYYFPRKADLWIATAARAQEDMERELAELLASPGLADSTKDMRAKFVFLIGQVVRNHQRTRMIISLVLQAQEDPELIQLCRDHAERSRNFLRIALGARYSDTTVELTLAALWGLGTRELITEEGKNDCVSLHLVEALFDMLERVTPE